MVACVFNSLLKYACPYVHKITDFLLRFALKLYALLRVERRFIQIIRAGLFESQLTLN